jgi:hypothetical protein
MIINVIHKPDIDNYGQYEGVTTVLVTEEGSKSVSFSGGEPEDMTISRDLNDAWFIKDLLVMAYNAGKNSETLEILETEETDE